MKKKIFVVDDSVTMRQQLAGFLKINGFDVLEASNGSEGVIQAKASQVDLMIVDVNMPVMNGIEMIREVENQPDHLEDTGQINSQSKMA